MALDAIFKDKTTAAEEAQDRLDAVLQRQARDELVDCDVEVDSRGQGVVRVRARDTLEVVAERPLNGPERELLLGLFKDETALRGLPEMRESAPPEDALVVALRELAYDPSDDVAKALVAVEKQAIDEAEDASEPSPRRVAPEPKAEKTEKAPRKKAKAEGPKAEPPTKTIELGWVRGAGFPGGPLAHYDSTEAANDEVLIN